MQIISFSRTCVWIVVQFPWCRVWKWGANVVGRRRMQTMELISKCNKK